MSTSNYPFLARNQKTEEDKQRDNINSLWNQLGVIGVNNQNSFFTGYGNDNQLQPERPTGILNTNQGPRTIHEGERLDVGQNGEFSVTPASQIGGQGNLQDIEQKFGMRGYQWGTPEYGKRFTQEPKEWGTQQFGAPQKTAEVTANLPERITPQIAPVSQNIATSGTARGSFGYGPTEESSPQIATSGTKRGAFSYGPTEPETVPEPAQPTTTEDVNKYEPYMERGLQRLERYADVESPREAAIRAGERERFAGEAAAAQGALTQEMAQYGITGREAATASARLGRQIGARESQLMADLRKEEADRAFTAARQIPGEARATETQEFQREQLEFEKQKYGDQQFERMADAAQTTSFESWQKMFPDATQEDYNTAREYKARELKNMDIQNEAARLGVDSNRLQAFINAVNTGSDLATANQVSGLNLTADQYSGIKRDYTYEGQVQQATISRLIGELGDQRVNSISNMVGKGASLDQVNEAFGLDLSIDDFQNILGATPYGETKWQRTLSGANMLLQSMDPTNIAQAEGVLNDLFPGVTFDMGQLIQDVGADRYAQSMSDLAILASTFSTWDEAKTSAEGLNLINSLGMNNEQAAELFEGLKVNAIGDAWEAIENDPFYQNLLENDPDAAQLIKDTFVAGLTGELEFDITPSYHVTDEAGNLVQRFDNIADANKFLGENADKGYSVEEKKDYHMRSLYTGDTFNFDNNGKNLDEKPTTISGKWDEFEKTIPSAIKESLDYDPEKMYNQWAFWQKTDPENNTYDSFKPTYETNVKEQATKLLNNEYDKKATEMDVNDPVFQEMLRILPTGVGDRGYTDGVYTYGNLENAIEKGIPVEIEGQYYFVVDKVVVSTGKKGGTRYILHDVNDRSKRVNVYATRDEEPQMSVG